MTTIVINGTLTFETVLYEQKLIPAIEDASAYILHNVGIAYTSVNKQLIESNVSLLNTNVSVVIDTSDTESITFNGLFKESTILYFNSTQHTYDLLFKFEEKLV